MKNDEYQQVIDKLQLLISETQTTLKRFEETGMDTHMQDDYDKLLDVLDAAIKQQREHTQGMLVS
ncbi:hypothetical protein [Halomonas sp. PA16-9]|uniref:hypothetical protein n=1 Tax=Halomonas sp. PA16-9 TaxID=2576841 RepID=UPI0012DAE8EC|nr:hypothetical protein FDY98_17865 [Halomonas sp. PA16-9]